MIEKTNITIENKLTNQIYYELDLDDGVWRKFEYNTRGNTIYYETSDGFWCKEEYDTRGNRIYFENNKEVIVDDR